MPIISFGSIFKVSAKALPLPQWIFSYTLELGTHREDVIEHLADQENDFAAIDHSHGGDFDSPNVPIASVTPQPSTGTHTHNVSGTSGTHRPAIRIA